MLRIKATSENIGKLKKAYPQVVINNAGSDEYIVSNLDDTIVRQWGTVVGGPATNNTTSSIIPINPVRIKGESSEPQPPQPQSNVEQPPAMPAPVENLFGALSCFQDYLLAQARQELQTALDATKQTISQQIAELQNMVTVAKKDMISLSVDLKNNIDHNRREIDGLLVNTRQTIEAKIANINELAVAAQKEIAQAKSDSIANITEQTQNLQTQINELYQKQQLQDQENTKSHIAFVAFIDTLKKAWSDLMMTLDGNANPVPKSIASQQK